MITFLRHTLVNFHHTGAVLPSSPWLARALTAPLARRGQEPIEVLEAGPGTGALTTAVVRHLRPGDHLTLCEINACFVSYLEERFSEDPLLKPYRDQVTIYHGPVEELEARERFDHIVSGLPFNNFDPALVRQIFETFSRAIRPGGTVNYFEYAGIRALKATVSSDEERQRLEGVEDVLAEYLRHHRHERHLVLRNVPPAWACSILDFGAGVHAGQATA